MADVDVFDAAAYGISASEALNIDPQHRLILEVSGEALSVSGAAAYTTVHPSSTAPSRGIGVFVGISWTEYAQLTSRSGASVTAYTAQGAVLSVCPGRVAFHYGFKGPAIAVDTACSSSLVATASGHAHVLESLGGAVCAGINMMLMPETTYMFRKAGMLSLDGRCKALDARADGYVRSEAAGAMVLTGHVKENFDDDGS